MTMCGLCQQILPCCRSSSMAIAKADQAMWVYAASWLQRRCSQDCYQWINHGILCTILLFVQVNNEESATPVDVTHILRLCMMAAPPVLSARWLSRALHCACLQLCTGIHDLLMPKRIITGPLQCRIISHLAPGPASVIASLLC